MRPYMIKRFILFICFLLIPGIISGFVWEIRFKPVLTLHLMHTNDLHAHLIPFNTDNRVCTPQTPDCLGGFARIKTAIDTYRTQYPDMILLDAGDRFSGTVFYTLRKGYDIIRLMNNWQYDAFTLGNHDFDDGLPELEKMMRQLNTPVIAANVIFPQTTPLHRQVLPSVIIERNNTKIGIIGAVTDHIKTETAHADTITLKPLTDAIQTEIQKLKQQNIDKIILLSHVGFNTDKKLAQELTDIDIIVGGHSHTLLSNTPPQSEALLAYPTIIYNPDKKPVLIVSAGYGGQHVGQLHVSFNRQGDIISYTGNTLSVDTTISQDISTQKQLSDIEQKLSDILHEPLTEFASSAPLTRQQNFCSEECYAGEILTDLIKKAVPEAEIVLLNAGSIRAGLPKGEITFKHLAESYPFDSQLVLTPMTAAEIQNYLEHGLKKYRSDNRTNAFMQIAGAHYTFDSQTKKISSLTYDTPKQANEVYQVALSSFIANGGDGYPKRTHIKLLPASVRDVMKTGLHNSNYQMPVFQKRIKKEK